MCSCVGVYYVFTLFSVIVFWLCRWIQFSFVLLCAFIRIAVDLQFICIFLRRCSRVTHTHTTNSTKIDINKVKQNNKPLYREATAQNKIKNYQTIITMKERFQPKNNPPYKNYLVCWIISNTSAKACFCVILVQKLFHSTFSITV